MYKYFIVEKIGAAEREITKAEYDELLIGDAKYYCISKTNAVNCCVENRREAKIFGQSDWIMFNGGRLIIKNITK